MKSLMQLFPAILMQLFPANKTNMSKNSDKNHKKPKNWQSKWDPQKMLTNKMHAYADLGAALKTILPLFSEKLMKVVMES